MYFPRYLFEDVDAFGTPCDDGTASNGVVETTDCEEIEATGSVPDLKVFCEGEAETDAADVPVGLPATAIPLEFGRFSGVACMTG